MDYKKLVDELEDYFDIYTDLHPAIFDEAATAITDLLARAEAAEARAEKAERERDAAVKDLKDEVMGKIWACDYCKKNDPENFCCKRDNLFGCAEWEWNGGKKEG